MSQHAKLSPSASERWIECPASIRMESQLLDLGVKEEESFYAEEGTCAHALGEIKASLEFGFITEEQYHSRRASWRKRFGHILDHDTEAEMDKHTDSYVELIKERLALYPNSKVLLEQRMDTGVPTSWGTSDVVIFSPQHVEVIDLKYGTGVRVFAKGNSQTRLYLCGGMDTFADILGETELVRATIFQPRLNHLDTEELTPQELRDWRDSIIPIAEEALGDNAHFSPTDEACRWCPASGRCPAQIEAVFSVPFEEDTELLTPEQMSETLDKLQLVKDWVNAFEVAALTVAYSEGKTIPRYKVVKSGGQRSILNKERAIDFLVQEQGYEIDQVSKRSIRGIGELENLMGVEGFAEIMVDYIKPPEGKPSLVPEDDPRPAINPNNEAAKAFGEDLI